MEKLKFIFFKFQKKLFCLLISAIILFTIINCALSQQSYTWTGSVSQSFNTSGNWSPSGIPGQNDTIIVNTGTLNISTGNHVHLGGIYFNYGTISATDSVSFSGKMYWNGGLWTGSGTLVCAEGASMFIQNTMNNIFDQGVLLNMGTIYWQGTGNFSLNNGAHLKNIGLIEIKNNAALNHSGGNITTFSNLSNGIITKTSGSKTIIGAALNLINDGLIEIPNGSLEIRSNGTVKGTVEIKNGTLLTLSGGTMQWNPSSVLITNGALLINAGTYNFGGTVDIANKTTVQLGSTSNFSGPVLELGDTLISSGSYVNFYTDSVQIPLIEHLSGNLGGTAVIEVGQSFNWTGGMILGTGSLIIPQNCVLNIAGDQTKWISLMTLNNFGTISWEGTGQLNMDNGATINNSGLFDIKNNSTIFRSGGNTVTLNNLPEGTIRKISDGRTIFGQVIEFNQQGYFDIQSGTLSLGSTSNFTGTLKSDENTMVTIDMGIQNFNPGITLDIGGMLAIKGGTARFNIDYTLPPGTVMVGGELGGAGTIGVTDTLIWSGGTITDTGYLKIDTTGQLFVGSYNNKMIFRRKLLNYGTITFSEGPVTLTRYSEIINKSKIVFGGPYNASICCGGGGPDPKFINLEDGYLLIDPANGTTTFTNFDIDNYGIIDVRQGIFAYTSGIFRQMNGTFILDSAEFRATREIAIQGGTLIGDGLISGNLVNSGKINPGIDSINIGRIEITGQYIQNPSGILKIDIGGKSPGTGHDQLTTGSSVLAGNLEIGYLRNYIPEPEDKFRVVRWLQQPNTGTFTAITNLTYTENDSLAANYNHNNLTLSGKNVRKELWLQLSGPSVVRPLTGNTISILYGNESPDTLVFPLLLEFNDINSYELLFDYVHNPAWIPWEDTLLRDMYDELVEDVFVYEDGKKVMIPLIITAPGSPSGSSEPEINQLDVSLSPKCTSEAGMTASMGDPLTADLEKCLFGVGGELIGFLPGSDCVKFGLKLALSGLQLYSDDLNGRPLSLSGFLAANGADLLKCATGAIPGLAFLQKTAKITDEIMSGVGLLNTLMDCKKALLPQDGGESASRGFVCVGSRDPNEKTGPDGFTPLNYIRGNHNLAYSVYFENVDTATAPAQKVIVTDTLDADYWDFSTFSFVSVTIGDTMLKIPSYSNDFILELDMRPDRNILTSITGNFNDRTGVITWEFVSLDPDTHMPVTDPLAGFLPPNIAPPEGQGSVTYVIQPNLDLSTGTLIGSKARIVFDQNEAMYTNLWENHLDRTKPVSTMTPIANVQDSCNIRIKWTGLDEHSGIRNYFVYVSENNSPFYKWLSTVDTFAIFNGDTCNLYSFFVTSVDSAGNLEKEKNAEVQVMINPFLNPGITASTETSVCLGDTVVLNALTKGNVNYQWFRDDQPLENENDSVYFASLPGNYSVSAGISENCNGTSDKITVTIKSAPQPEIIANGDLLETASGEISYQWYLNSTPLEGALNNTYLAVISGEYQVMVTGANGCTGMSPEFSHTVSVANDKEFIELSPYPNLVQDILYVPLRGIISEKVTIQIMNLTGSVIRVRNYKISGSDELLEIPTGDLKPGEYFLKLILNDEEVRNFRFSKL